VCFLKWCVEKSDKYSKGAYLFYKMDQT